MDQQLKIKTYSPDGSNYAPRISNEQWEQHKSLLKHLHDEGYKRAAMLEILRKQGFTPSSGQLNTKMTAWGFKVYGTQPETQDQELDTTMPPVISSGADIDMTNFHEDQPSLNTTARRSVSSITLHEPEMQWATSHNDSYLALDEVILLETARLRNRYQPSTRPSDFGFKVSNESTGNSEGFYKLVISVADFLCAVHCFSQAFDLYYYVLEHITTYNHSSNISLVRTLVQCAISATIDSQVTYTLSIIRRAHSYCIEHSLNELATFFAHISRDLSVKDVKESDLLRGTQNDPLSEMPLLLATDLAAGSVAYRKEWLQHHLLACDKSSATLTHLSSWCQDTLSYYRLENQVIVEFSSNSTNSNVNEVAAFEHDFQLLVSALIIDFLNSPGPSMKKADVECKDDNCIFRWTLSPSTSLIIMAHLLYEPLRLQSQKSSNQYLRSRAASFASTRSTTALQELKAFASADSNARCAAFVDTFVKHFNTTLAFRRFVSTTKFDWDRMNAAKRLAALLQSNATGLLPHAGLPSARRSLLKTMVAPFPQGPHDPMMNERQASVSTNSSSMNEFARLASQIGASRGQPGNLTPSDAMSIDTRSSWSFSQVTGLGHYQPPMSGRGSLSSRRGRDDIDEYRNFIKDNNYSQRNMESDQSSYSTTPTNQYSSYKADP